MPPTHTVERDRGSSGKSGAADDDGRSNGTAGGSERRDRYGRRRHVEVRGTDRVPSESVTSMFPSVAPAGTVAVICVSELTVKAASTLLNSTSFTTEAS